MIKRLFFSLSIVVLTNQITLGQGSGLTLGGQDVERNPITTATPFLTISPDARSGAMGDVGAAISPDANSIFWNPAKLAFAEKDMGFAISYTPWLRKLVNDMSLSYLSGYKKLRKEEAIGISMNYFNLGNITFTDINGNNMGDFRPKEFSFTGCYSRKLSKTLGVAVGLKYIHSNLSGSISINNSGTTTAAKPGNTAAGDIGVYFNNDYIIAGTNTNIALGAMLSNLGAKISYTNSSQKDFIPTSLRVGTAVTTELDPYNKLVFALDANKLLVPTPPQRDSLNNIVKGKDPERNLLSGVLGSFSDAPGGFKEEMQEIILSGGVEYWYNDLFAVRGGYFYENPHKGNRKYFTLGFGIRYQVFGLDFAYLVPVRSNNPLAETLRFTLHFNFERKSQKDIDTITE
ncbi:type IX secretion system outer membrane channel protein PorV [Sporocytophaga myxococcoides]|nr:type IX secretion system outer membrane channel protein PorV [Sporocytophaga myxococcoides]